MYLVFKGEFIFRGIIIYLSLFSFLVASDIDDEIERLKQENRELELKTKSNKQKELESLNKQIREIKLEEVSDNLDGKAYFSLSANLITNTTGSKNFFIPSGSFAIGAYFARWENVFIRGGGDIGMGAIKGKNMMANSLVMNLSQILDIVAHFPSQSIYLIAGIRIGLGGVRIMEESLFGIDYGGKIGFAFDMAQILQIEIGAKVYATRFFVLRGEIIPYNVKLYLVQAGGYLALSVAF